MLVHAPLLVPLAQAEGGSPLAGLLFPLLLLAVFYFILIRPQQRRARQQRQLVASIQAGDQVVTIGGLHGTIRTVEDRTARLELAPGLTITIDRQAVGRKITPEVVGDTGVS